MKQVSKGILALLLVIYIVVLVLKISNTMIADYPTAYNSGDTAGEDATIGLYLNIAPILVENISDISWYQTYTYTGLDLDDHFNDTVGEFLTYTFSGPQDIAVAISNESIVTLIAVESSWTGDNNITFTATDNHGLSIDSNFVNLTIIPYSGDSSSSSGSGGGGGGGGGTKLVVGECNESWACTDWSDCINNIQTRSCIDRNECATELEEPSLSQSCLLPGEVPVDYEDEDIIAPIFKEVSHRPILWVVSLLGLVFSAEVYLFIHKRMKAGGNNYG